MLLLLFCDVHIYNIVTITGVVCVYYKVLYNIQKYNARSVYMYICSSVFKKTLKTI